MNGAILAGGAASRMGGVNKGLLAVGGRRIVDRLVAAFEEALGVPPLLVANAPEAPSWCPGLRVVPDRRGAGGTLAGLYTAVVEGPAPVVVAAWDMPFVSAALLRALADGLADHDAFLPASEVAVDHADLKADYESGGRSYDLLRDRTEAPIRDALILRMLLKSL